MLIPLLRLLLALCLPLSLWGCPQGSLERKTNQQRSRELLAQGLEAQRKGQDDIAKQRMEEALEVDPLNARARTSLASLHAGKAGVVLARLVEPLYLASAQLDSPSNALLEELRQSKARELEQKFQASRASTQSAQSPTEQTQAQVKTQAQAQAQAALDEAQKVVSEFSAAVTQAHLALVVFNTLPLVNEAASKHLEAAIAVLRNDSIAPSARDEETRAYLAILASVRFVSDVRLLLGKNSFAFGDLEDVRTSLCSLPRESLRASLVSMRQSLTHMEEGLTPVQDEPNTSKRRQRKRMQEFVSKLLSFQAFQRAEDVFKPRAEGAPSTLLEELGTLWCALPKAMPHVPKAPSRPAAPSVP